MMYLAGFLWIFGCLFAGEWIVHAFDLPLPSSIIGLLLLFLLLCVRPQILSYVKGVAGVLLGYLAFLVVPATISIVKYLHIIQQDAIALLFGTVISTLLVLLVAGKTYSVVRDKLRANKAGGKHE